jgi:hypothetical protein
MPSPVIQISSNYAMNHVENPDGSYEYQGSATGIQIAFLAVTTGSSTITVTLPALVPIAPSYAPIGTQSWTVTVRKVDSGGGRSAFGVHGAARHQLKLVGDGNMTTAQTIATARGA